MACLHISFRALSLSSSSPLTSTIKPSRPQTRAASVLSNLGPVPSSIRNKKRLGRGPASGKGKTSGRGHKGQKQHGKVPAGFQGGQTPAEVSKGKRGIQTDVFRMDLRTLNVDRVQSWIDQGRLDPRRMITLRELAKSRCLHGVGDGVKLLARNAEQLRTALHITVSRASASAIAAIEKAGGSVQTRYYTKSSIKRIMQGQTHPFLSRLSPSQRNAEPAAASPTTTQEPSEIENQSEPMADANTVAQRTHSPATGEPLTVPSEYPPPETFRYRLPDAYSRRDLEYYRDPAHRGYLSYQLKEGQGPSLYFRSPQELKEESIARKRAKRRALAGQTDEGQERKIDTGRIW